MQTNEKKQTIVRVVKDQDNPYVMMSKTHLNDPELSWAEKGLMSYLLSKPDDWQIYLVHLEKQSNNKKTATSNALNGLIKNGYIVRNYKRENGRFKGREYHVYEGKSPKSGFPTSVNPNTENQPLLNNELTKERKKLINDSSSKYKSSFISTTEKKEVDVVKSSLNVDRRSKEDKEAELERIILESRLNDLNNKKLNLSLSNESLLKSDTQLPFQQNNATASISDMDFTYSSSKEDSVKTQNNN